MARANWARVPAAYEAANAALAAMSRRICTFEAAINGMILSRTTTATIDHTDCAIALAAGGDVRAVLVSQLCRGHRARRPATPMNRRMEAAVSDLRPTPRVV